MRGRRLCVFTAAGLVLAAAPPVVAHHSFAAEYDTTKSIALTGVVTKLEWTNPHAHIYVDAKDASGNAVTVTLAGGRKVFAGSSADGAEPHNGLACLSTS
jgi:hypothetical protein